MPRLRVEHHRTKGWLRRMPFRELRLRLCLANTLHSRRINDLEEHLPGALFAMIP